MKTNHERMDPELADVLAAIPTGPAGIFDLNDIEGTRAAVRMMAAEASAAASDDPTVSVEVVEVSRPDGPPVSIRLFRPAALPGPLPALLWFHGGGQVLGYAAQEDPSLKRICAEVGCMIAAVDYRLAPETRSPGAAEDGYLAYQWFCREAEKLGVDASRIGVLGVSGGGCIAAATALMIRDHGAPPLLFQMLHYPMLDDRNETPSSREITDIGVWDRHNNILAWKAVLGDQTGGADVSSYSAPARAADLAGLPPTFIAVGELDLFRDEDLTYATRLMASGIPTEFHLYPGAFHAWDLFAPDSSLAATFLQTWYSYLCRQFRV